MKTRTDFLSPLRHYFSNKVAFYLSLSHTAKRWQETHWAAHSAAIGMCLYTHTHSHTKLAACRRTVLWKIQGCQIQPTSFHGYRHSTSIKQTSLSTLDITFITSLPGDSLRNSWQLLPPMLVSPRKVPSVPSAWLGEGRGSGLKCFSFVSFPLSALAPSGDSSTEHAWQVSICIFRLLVDGLSSSGALVTDCSIWEINQEKVIMNSDT